MAKVLLSLGSNMGNKIKQLSDAREAIAQKIGTLKKSSAVYETPAWGYEDNNYLNSAVLLDTEMTPDELLTVTQGIEKSLGRTQKTIFDKNGTPQYNSRPIDIDILYYNDLVVSKTHLTIPHPHIQDRNFVLFPLNDIAPEFVHPILKKSNSSIKSELPRDAVNNIFCLA